MSLKNRIQANIAAFDRRSPSILGETEAQFGADRGYVPALVGLAGHEDAPVSSGATWLIKAYLEAGGGLTAPQTARLVKELIRVREWDSQLHICQSVRFLTLKTENAAQLVDWLRPLLRHKRPFLRAWSLDALCRVAAEHGSFRGPAKQALEEGLEDRSASVRARSRQIQKELKALASELS